MKILAICDIKVYNYPEVSKLTGLSTLKKHLRPGGVYRRADLARWSNAVDRHLCLLQKEGTLEKLSPGLYLAPKFSRFGPVPADEQALISSFLKDSRFLIHRPSAYNALGLGTTQLYNETIVYNHKRHGRFKLGNRYFDFRVKPHFPKTITKEFLLVDLVNNLDELSEDRDQILDRVRKYLHENIDSKKLTKAARDYGNMRTKRFFEVAIS